MIPLELITGGVSFILSFASKCFAMKQKSKHEERIATLQALAGKETTLQNARAFKEEGISFTRRTIAFAVIGAAFIAPIAMPFMDITTYIQQITTSSGGFWPFIDPTVEAAWYPLPGYVTAPLLGHAAMAVLGFYFGQANHK